MRRSQNTTPSTGSKRSRTSSTTRASPPPPDVSQTTSTRSSCTCAYPSDTDDDGDRRTLLEQSLGEVKRRTKVMGRFPGEDSCLTLVWAVLDLLITHQTNGVHFNALDRQRLKRARYQGNEQAIPQKVTAA
jgi:hypothetical protein